MAGRYNEGKAIDAVLRRIEARHSVARASDGWSPDDERDPDKNRRVDYVCTVGDQLYAFEHTGIEPFEKQIEMEVQNRSLLDPVITYFSGRVPKGEYWELHCPVEASAGVSGDKAAKARAGLIGWITANAATLPLVRYGDRYPYSMKESAPDVPFRFALYRWAVPDCGLSGVIWRREFVSGDLEQARHGRLERVCDDKFAKLLRWKQSGAHTILVMEENDLSLTNHQLVAEAMMRAEAGRTDIPDEIFLVSTVRPNPWWVTCLRREGANYYDDDERFHEIDPATLTPLTKR